MSASKNDKVDTKPALQYIHPRIWREIRGVIPDNSPFTITLLDLINDIKDGSGTLEDVLELLTQVYGPSKVLRSCGMALRAGELKYGEWDFLKGHGRFQLLAAMERHALLMLDGEYLDADTTKLLGADVPHFGCIIANINMIYYQEQMGTLIEDGPPTTTKTSTPVDTGDYIKPTKDWLDSYGDTFKSMHPDSLYRVARYNALFGAVEIIHEGTTWMCDEYIKMEGPYVQKQGT